MSCFKVVLDKDWKFVDGLRKKNSLWLRGFGIKGHLEEEQP